MKIPRCCAGLLLIIFIVSCPVSAFTAKSLDITVHDSLDAAITFEYELTWFENVAVFSRMVDPAAELAKALRSEFKKTVDVTGVSGNQARFLVDGYATRSGKDDLVTLSTPPLSFTRADRALQQYWFAPLISPDFSPAVTRITFPDGYYEEFYNLESIPAVRHSIMQPR